MIRLKSKHGLWLILTSSIFVFAYGSGVGKEDVKEVLNDLPPQLPKKERIFEDAAIESLHSRFDYSSRFCGLSSIITGFKIRNHESLNLTLREYVDITCSFVFRKPYTSIYC